MKPYIKAFFLVLVVVILSPSSHLLAQQEKIEQLEHRVKQLEQTVLRLQRRISEIESKAGSSHVTSLPITTKRNWRNKSNWRRLRRGMTKDQVTELLGEPEKVDTGIALIFWYWGYPTSGASVDFDANSSRLVGWSEPTP